MATVSCVTFDCQDPDRVAAFWAEALRWQRNGDRVDSPGGEIYLEFVKVPESKSVKNRLHLGLNAPDLDAEIQRLIGLGATIAWEEEFPEGWPFRNVVLRDPEGNEFCLGNEVPAGVKRLLGID
jgi:predicted enzyme related to lactoylglutathione lyase